ncbi:MAG: hypothetical protein H6739_24920 [Alphaproteobacteria bacterium]|nr:hypothetical protein [Alphaproteobacteria bacterium]
MTGALGGDEDEALSILDALEADGPAAAMTAAAMASGQDPGPWLAFGVALTGPVRLLEALGFLWAGDGEAEVLAVLADVLGVFGGDHRLPERRALTRLALGTPTPRAALREAFEASLAACRRAAAPLPEIATRLTAALSPGLAFHETLATLARLERRPRPPSVQDALEGGLVALAAHAPGWQESWEIQRWGGPEPGAALVGSWFARATIAQALHEAGVDQREVFVELLDAVDDEGPRYFGPWRGIPPDADDLGLALQLAAALETPPTARVERWLEVMRLSARPDGQVPTWLTRGPDGPTWEGAVWAGDDCAAVGLQLVAGLKAWCPGRFPRLEQATLQAALATLQGGELTGSFFYPPGYAARLVLRAVGPHPALLARARDPRNLHMGWRDPLRAAADLELLARHAPVDEARLEAGLAWLVDLQRHDGLWPEVPFFRTLRKHHGRTWHGGRLLTTALVIRAMRATLDAIGGGVTGADP